MKIEEIDALLGGEAQKLADKYTSVPLDFMDGYGWAVTQICRLYHDAVPVRHGYWIDIDEQSYTWKVRCSCCGHERSMMSTQGEYPKYCEECGARMDEVEK